ncbi:MAG: transaldolase, partial [Calditrichaeota bacterium]
MKTINISLNAEGKKQFQDSLSRLNSEGIISRIWKHDHTVWKEDPTEISNRLGWLHCYETMSSHLSEIESFVNEVRAAGYTHALLLGMGGSSLAPEIMRFIFGVKKGYLELSVLDSTDPAAVLEKQQGLNPEKTLIVVSTKSGGTIETLSFMKYFYNVFLKTLGSENVGEHFVAITDPGSR